MTELERLILADLEIGPATKSEIAQSLGRHRGSIQGAVDRLYAGYRIARADMIDIMEIGALSKKRIYMLPEHAKSWGGEIAACRDGAHSG